MCAWSIAQLRHAASMKLSALRRDKNRAFQKWLEYRPGAEENLLMQLSHLFRNPEFFVPYNAGDVIFKEGEPGKTMYVVLEGEVDVLLRDRIVETIGPEQFFGELALIEERPRSATAVARTRCKLAPINHARFNFLVQQTPHFALHVMRGMADRLRRRD